MSDVLKLRWEAIMELTTGRPDGAEAAGAALIEADEVLREHATEVWWCVSHNRQNINGLPDECDDWEPDSDCLGERRFVIDPAHLAGGAE